MIYECYQTYADTALPARLMAAAAQKVHTSWSGDAFGAQMRSIAAFCELVELAGFTHERPDYEIDSIEVGGVRVPVEQEVVAETPFCDLLRFRKAGSSGEPKVLLAAPMSGHFATLLRGTIRSLVRDCEVHVTDWRNVRDIPLSEGSFGLDDFTRTLIHFMHALGPRQHLVAVCQPTVSALAATALMAQDRDPDRPASLTLMAGPIDTRVNPTKVNDLAKEQPIDWFRDKMISTIPARLRGAGRRVYPGFVQLSAFMSMNLDRHRKSFADLFQHRVKGETDKADAINAFYREYFAIMDLSADFYLDTIERVFQRHDLPLGQLTFENRVVDPAAIRDTFLLTVEGERDDICAIGQTLAAQDLCKGLKPYMKSHHMQPGVGHYGVFSGKRWETQIYPLVRNHIEASL